MEGIDIAWVEEAQSISEDSLKVLAPTISKSGNQLIFSHNRLNELDPVHERYVLKKPSRTFVRKVNYYVLQRAGLLPEALKLERDEDAKDPALFAHVWLGEPVSQEDTIISRLAILDAMKREVSDEGVVEIGADDARMGNDRTMFMKRKGLKLIKTRSYTKLRTTEESDKLEQFAGYDKKILLKIDGTGVGGRVTDEMIKRGYYVLPINFGSKPDDPDKCPNLISEAWFYMAQIMPTIQLDMKHKVLMELSNRHSRMDTKGRPGEW